MVSVPTSGDVELQNRVRDGVERVESALREALKTPDAFAQEAAQHLLNAGGKRFRPLMVLLCSEFGSPATDDVVTSAVVVELTHLATLYHDDVMDEAALRRGAPSANARWNNSVAVLVGDFVFARASSLVAGLGPEAVRIQADTFARLVRGQIRETLGPGEGEDPLRHYLDVVADKTGSLIATSALFGAKMAGADLEIQETLVEFGERIGAAFQLADDILDIASDTSGKVPGTDLREGVPTLPTLLALRSTDAADERLRGLLAGPIASEDDVAWVLSTLRTHPVLDEARAYVRHEADLARAQLAKLPAGSARDALADLCTQATDRIV